jgi:hypothetical protein
VESKRISIKIEKAGKKEMIIITIVSQTNTERTIMIRVLNGERVADRSITADLSERYTDDSIDLFINYMSPLYVLRIHPR